MPQFPWHSLSLHSSTRWKTHSFSNRSQPSWVFLLIHLRFNHFLWFPTAFHLSFYISVFFVLIYTEALCFQVSLLESRRLTIGGIDLNLSPKFYKEKRKGSIKYWYTWPSNDIQTPHCHNQCSITVRWIRYSHSFNHSLTHSFCIHSLILHAHKRN